MVNLSLLGAPTLGGVSIEQFFFAIAIILAAAKLGGELAIRLGQPAVLGELLAGVLLGSSVFGVIPADGQLHGTIGLLAEIGVVLLLFEIGLETDLREMFSVGRAAVTVAMVGVIAPFALGFGTWALMTGDAGTTAIFVGATMTATSVGITSRVLSDLGQMNTREARVILGAAIIDDVLGLVILAIVSGLAAGAALSVTGVALKFAVAVGFLVAAVVLGRWFVPKLFSVLERMQVRGVLFVAAFSFVLALAALAGSAGSALIIGAFAAGLILSSTNHFDLITRNMHPVSDIFAPIFFVYVGSSVNVALLNPASSQFSPTVLVVAAALLAVAVIGKLASGFAVGWGRDKLSHLAIGIGMVPRGEVGLIFAHLGLDNGVIDESAFNALVLVVMLTTFVAPPLLKVLFKRSSAPSRPVIEEMV
ncbi:MAG TPA: cation:proton antiporter [Longimicrobiales bacterium]